MGSSTDVSVEVKLSCNGKGMKVPYEGIEIKITYYGAKPKFLYKRPDILPRMKSGE